MAEPTKIIKVLIIDKDKFFIAGLRCLITDFYLSKNIEVEFITQPVSGLTADIIFQAFGYGVMLDIWRYQLSGASSSLFFFIRDHRENFFSPIFRTVRKGGALYRNQPIDAVKSMLEEAISKQRYPSPGGVTRNLTLRESEVLRYLRQGKSQVETANMMGLHVKTVSTHKRSAMRKLNFKRDHQLYHWLLQGSLSSVRR